MSALSLQRREAINSRSKHSLESNHEKGTKTSYTDGFVPLYTSKKSYYAFSQTDFYHKTNPNLFFRKGSDQKFLVEHRRFELLTSTMRMSRATNCPILYPLFELSFVYAIHITFSVFLISNLLCTIIIAWHLPPQL